MFDVTVINLSRDASTAIPDLGASHLGTLDRDRLAALLDSFRSVDAIQNHDADPHIAVQTTQGKYLVRTGHGRLFLYNARDSAEPYSELDTEGVLRQLELVRRSEGEDAPDHREERRTRTPNHAISIAILVSGLLLNGYTVYSVFQAESVNQQPAVTIITSGQELSALQQSAAGTYATGSASGDRTIEVLGSRLVRFHKVVTNGTRLESEDGFRLGRQNAKTYLVTGDSGLIEVSNIDTLIYYRDVYRRTK